MSAFVKAIRPKVIASVCASAATLTLSVASIVSGALPLDSPYTVLVLAGLNAAAPPVAAWLKREELAHEAS